MISIITPTYNRSYTLTRLYNSLVDQTDNDFEWIIVDDGSTDDTARLISNILKNSVIPTYYYYQNNQGKPSAINTGVSYATKEYILIVDSDDILTKDAIRSIKESIVNIKSLNTTFSGICFRKANFNGKLLGEKITSHQIYSYLTATEGGHLFKGDLAYCFKKIHLINNKFPYFTNEKFVPELYIWNKITDEGKVYFHNTKVIYLCEYLPDGLSINFKTQLKNNPNGFLLFYKDQFNRENSSLEKIKKAIRIIQCYYYRIIK